MSDTDLYYLCVFICKRNILNFAVPCMWPNLRPSGELGIKTRRQPNFRIGLENDNFALK